MQIWVDTDTCPLVIKEILFRVGENVHVPVVLVANKKMRVPTSKYIQSVKVRSGADETNRHIVQNVHSNDLVITADLPLAAKVIDKGGYALNPRGTLYSQENISYFLVTREMQVNFPASKVKSVSPKVLSLSERENFTNQLDWFLTENFK